MIDRFKSATLVFIQLALVLLAALFLIRIFEILLNGFTHEFPQKGASFVFWALLGDVVFWFKGLFLEYIFFVLLAQSSLKLSKVLFKIFIILMIIIQIGLVQYFNTSLVPLGADLYGYSIADIKQTVGASTGLGIQLVVSFILLVALVLVALKFLPGKIQLPFWAAVIFPGLSLFFLVTGVLQLMRGRPFQSDFDNNLVLNKTDYFFVSSYLHFYPPDEESDIYADAYIGDYGDTKTVGTSFKYTGGSEFPFLHEVSDQDVLSSFFNLSPSRPNIVIILVEGLGRAFTNEGAYLGNFTPFLDSLSGKSLYWKNFLSEGGRTFAVLPSLMASLPFSKNGFLELGDKMPPHASLYSLLKFNGYTTSFYYGGDASFDNMSLFLKKNHVDELRDIQSFPGGYVKLPAVNGFTWGYNDKELFRHYLATRADEESKSPELNVILTVASHNPFLVNDQPEYVSKFEQRMDELGFENPKKDTYRNYKLQYSSIMYTDDALRSFFQECKKRKDFANTIFVITGDHRMPEIPMSSKIDRYHVPLIIYSPLLKRNAQFASVSTHFDIVPSLLSFLKASYKLKVPDQASWMGEGLDTARNFRNVHQYPLIQTKTDIIDFIMGEYHLNGSSLYKMGPDLQEESVEDQPIYKRLKNAFDHFKRRNAGIGNRAGILPDSVLNKYGPTKH
ncbi:LTA synthase family protein [Pedobacter panaciterrae]|uniref:LTA synthase family protein n=1 Tax=Pedobacter panaciterrae TaxID=363849 RepID=UPI00155DC416|nr:LTA synthase family protein [Pedobacter panaciterrae]NQX55383.1 LTA synthase family protein [Pedobacter panaciterrae]